MVVFLWVFSLKALKNDSGDNRRFESVDARDPTPQSYIKR